MENGFQARVFISCGQKKNTNEVEIAHKIVEKLEKMGFDPYVAVEEQTLKGVKENIFLRLSKSEYFIFIDLKREKLENSEYRGALFSHQELAIAAFLNSEVLAFQEDGVKKDDGILKFIQANCIPFSDRHLLPDAVAEKVRERAWKPNWRNELSFERDDKEYNDAFDVNEQKNARWYHIKVRNLHQQEIARNCTAYLESVKNTSTGGEKSYERVEFKWKGVNTLGVSIPPESFRYLDAFHVYYDSYDSKYIVHLGINSSVVDFSHYHQLYRITEPNTYELTYIVFSENFPPKRSTLGLHIGHKLNDIKFYKLL